MLKAALSAVCWPAVRVPPDQTSESLIARTVTVLRRSASVKVREPVRVRLPEASVMAPVMTPVVKTAVSLVPTMVTVTVDVEVAPWLSFTSMV